MKALFLMGLLFTAVPAQAGAQVPIEGDTAAAGARAGFRDRLGLRLGVAASPLVGVSALYFYKTHTLRDGGWVFVDVAPSVQLTRLFSVELGVSAMVPVRNAWGFPEFRLAVTPALRLDTRVFYARAGLPQMFGEGYRAGFQAALGATLFDRLYVGAVGEAIPRDNLALFGLEFGVRFGAPFASARP